MRPESLKRAGRRAALTTGAIAVLSLLSFSPWNSDQHPAQAQDVIVVPKEGQSSNNSAFWNLFAPAPRAVAPQAATVKRPVQGEIPEPAPAFAVGGLQTALVATGPTSAEEDADLEAAVSAFTQKPAEGARHDFATTSKPFQDFLVKHPNSGWAMAVQTNLGHGYFNAGYFSRALDVWQKAWTLGKNTQIREAKLIADSAVAELARMHARVGHVEELERLFAEIGDRTVEDAAGEILLGAREGATVMRKQPEIAFLCGPKALVNVLRTQNASAEQIRVADKAESGPRGFTLAQVSELATQAAAAHTLIKRATGQPIPVPSVIHWKLNHYAAIIEQRADGYVVQDPTFASGLVLSVEAIDAESSGYFLVPEGAKATAVPPPADGHDPGAWRTVETASEEAATVYGMGYPSDHLTLDHTPDSPQTCPDRTAGLQQTQTNARMCASSAHTTLVSLTIRDPHIGYAASKGPPVEVQLTYMQREATQLPGVITYSNVGQKWVTNKISYVTDPADGTSWGSPRRYEVGGGAVDYITSPYGINGKLVYYRDYWTGDRFSRVPLSGAFTHFELERPDGSKRIYSHLDGATTGLRKVFLKQEIDPQGNVVTYNYTNLTGTQGSITCSPSCVRLDSITDAAGLTTTFSYQLSGYPLVITKVTDPFGRDSTLTYDSNAKLLSISDPIGITSTVAYDGSGLVNQLTTPYGVSSYSYGQNTGDLQRWLNITDPLGKVERIEHYRDRLLSMSDTEPTNEVPATMATQNDHMQVRNTFIWDRHVADLHGTTDYTKATLLHWTTDSTFTTTVRGIESAKKPLERRVWFNNEGQSVSSYSGYFGGAQTVIGRRLDDGTTQLWQATYSGSSGNIVTGLLQDKTDPKNRKTVYEYGNSNLDVTRIKQQISNTPTYDTLAEFTYDSNHNVLSKKDAAGQTWKYAYNTAGQLIYATNPLDQTRFWEYDGSARLTRVTVPVAVAHNSVTYGTTNAGAATAQSLNYTSACSGMTAPDNTNLPISTTDSDGYVKCYEYDDLDRIVKVKYPDGTTDLYDYTFPSGLSSQPTWTTGTGTVPTAGDHSLDVWKITDRQGRVTEYVYDRNRRLIKTIQKSLTINGTAGVDRTTQYAYYANGVLKDLTDANGNVTHWDIDIQSRPTSKTYASGTANAKTESYTYDVTGRLKTVTDALGQVKTYSYSVADEVTAITYTNHVDTNFPTPDVSFTYETWYPRLETMTDMSGLTGGGAPASATTTFSYVDPGTGCAPPSTLTNCGALKLRQETNNGYYNQHTAYFYDAAGRMSQRWAAETQESFGYDTLGRLNSYGTPLGTFTLGYLNNTGQLASRSVTNSSITLSQSYGYDTNANDRRLLTITSSSNAMRSYTLGYVNGGGVDRYNIRSVTESTASHPIGAQTWAHDYDGGDRLISSVGTLVSNTGATSNAGTYGWELDKLDNPTKATYPDYGGYDDYPTYLNTATPPADNNLNQMNKNAWWQGYTYDANGNTTAEVDLNNSSAPLRTYKWDMEGRLLQMTDPNASGGHTVRFHYDGMGRRILQKTTTNGTTTYKRFQWCGDRICQQRTTSTARVRSYLLTGEYDFTASKKYVYFIDHLGSVRDLADADTGARVGALDYTPYGSERDSDGVLPDFRYAGLMWIGDMGLYMSSTRAYDPGSMRWLNRDWIKEVGGINLYGYVGGNPLMMVDPDGMEADYITIQVPYPTLPRRMIPGTPEYYAWHRYLNGLGHNAQINLQDWWNQICEMANDDDPPIETPEEKIEKRKDYCTALYESIVKDIQAERNDKKRLECYAAAANKRAIFLQCED